LEVVRSRAGRSGTEAASLVPFAEAAARELQRITELIEALLLLARAGRTPVDLWMVLQPIARLYEAVAVAGEGEVVVERPGNAPLEVAVEAHLARLALASVLDALVQGAAHVRGTIRRVGDQIQVDFHTSLSPLPIAAAVKSALTHAGIELQGSDQQVTLLFAAAV
jgi:hypothetical protein